MKINLVDKETLQKLKLAQAAINYVNDVEGLVSANQKQDLRKTSGGVITALEKVRDGHADPVMQAKFAIAMKAGNCGEKGLLAFIYLIRQTIKPPLGVYYVSWKHGDHAFTLLGNLSSPKTLVVVDPWPKRTQACLWTDSYWCTALGEADPREDIEITFQGTTEGQDVFVGSGIVAHEGEFVISENKRSEAELNLYIRQGEQQGFVYNHEFTTKTNEEYIYSLGSAVKKNILKDLLPITNPKYLTGNEGKNGKTQDPSSLNIQGHKKPIHGR